jgi:membrane fusion protein (multidrug efflux system)
MRIGQPVRLTADLYGSGVEYTGRIAGLAAGTGAAFALLPAQNATGNGIKVVQRLPVRITLDPKQVAEHPLRIGLSMQAVVDVHDLNGPMLAASPRQQPAAQTDVFKGMDQGADEDVQRIIAANLGRRPAPSR